MSVSKELQFESPMFMAPPPAPWPRIIPPSNVEVADPFTFSIPPIYARPEVSKRPSVAVALPTPSPPDT